MMGGRRGGEIARDQKGGGGVRGGRTKRETERYQEGGGDVRDGRATGQPGRHRDDNGVLTRRTRGETAVNRESMGHELPSLMAAQEGIGYVIFNLAARESTPFHTTGERAFDAEHVCKRVCGQGFGHAEAGDGKTRHGLVDASIVEATHQPTVLGVISTKWVLA